jgi:FlaA1/EpsC-like NDP-sugar epimerase
MHRYFMTIPEAVSLGLLASVLGQSGETFVLDMGDPVRILDLADDLVRMSGLRLGQDIKVVYSGARPGEKLREELFLGSESYQRTEHEKIFISKGGSAVDATQLEQAVARLAELARQMQTQALLAQLQDIVPEFTPAGALAAQADLQAAKSQEPAAAPA